MADALRRRFSKALVLNDAVVRAGNVSISPSPTAAAPLLQLTRPSSLRSASLPQGVAACLDKDESLLEMRDEDENTPLQNAASDGHLAVLRLLLSRRAALESRNPSLKTALHEAAAGGQVQCAHALLAEGADINARDMFGQTPLFLAASAGECSVMRLLLRGVGRGTAELNTPNQDGQTALHVSAATGLLEVVNILLNSGANPGLRDASGSTAYDVAADDHRIREAIRQAMVKAGQAAPHPQPPPKASAKSPPPPPPPPRPPPGSTPPPPPPRPPPRAAPGLVKPDPAAAANEALESVMRSEINDLCAAIKALETPEAQRLAARRLRKRYHPDSVSDITKLLPVRAEVYLRLSAHANASTEGFLEGNAGASS